MDIIQNRTVKDWVVAVRPWSFTTSSVAVLVTVAYLFYISRAESFAVSVNWLNAALCLPLLMILHAGGNLVSDYYDFKRGVDGPDCVNGVTWIRSGMFKPKEILYYGWTLLAVGCVIGAVILMRSDFSAIWLGALGLLLPLYYYVLKANVLGDLDILLCFALLPGIGTCYVATGNYHMEMLLFCLPFGLHIVAILHANNTRDIAADRNAGLKTICGKVGERASQWIYLFEIALPYLLVVLFCLFAGLSWWIMITFLSLPIGIGNVKQMMRKLNDGKGGITRLDQSTAQFQFLFGILYALGFVLGGLF